MSRSSWAVVMIVGISFFFQYFGDAEGGKQILADKDRDKRDSRSKVLLIQPFKTPTFRLH